MHFHVLDIEDPRVTLYLHPSGLLQLVGSIDTFSRPLLNFTLYVLLVHVLVYNATSATWSTSGVADSASDRDNEI
jgi:hypothetical protein